MLTWQRIIINAILLKPQSSCGFEAYFPQFNKSQCCNTLPWNFWHLLCHKFGNSVKKIAGWHWTSSQLKFSMPVMQTPEIKLTLSGFTTSPGGLHSISDCPSTTIFVRYNSHFPLATSNGQSNSTARVPNSLSGCPKMFTYTSKEISIKQTCSVKKNKNNPKLDCNI